MKVFNNAMLAFLVAAIAFITLIQAAVADPGCCCASDGTAQTNSTQASQQECNPGFNFVQLSPADLLNSSLGCTVKCQQQAGQPPIIIAPGEDCGRQDFKPAPANVTATAVKGDLAIRLQYSPECLFDFVEISRCEGNGCTNFQQIARVQGTAYIDRENLKWNTDYTYKIIAHYVLSGDSNPATKVGNAGDIECFQQGTGQFCISQVFYERFTDYLKAFGYGVTAASQFQNNFFQAVNFTFGARYNRGFRCNDINRLQQTIACSSTQFCISDGTTAQCISPSQCEQGGNPFGLFFSQQSCEGTSPKKYCFFDKSTTVANTCYNCKPFMACYDYKTREACQRNNCLAGQCSWNPTFDSVGAGVCIDTRLSNCVNCDKKGTEGMENLAAFNEFYDKCSTTKAQALSTTENPCFFDPNTGSAKGCDKVACRDYNQQQCSSPANGITLDGNNARTASSNDPCRIQVCQFTLATGCVKNADGTPVTQVPFQDCGLNDAVCEADYFPPNSTLIKSGPSGKVEFLKINIRDRINFTDGGSDVTGKQGYNLFFCIVNATNNCNNAAQFTKYTNSTQLIVNNLALKDGTTPIANLSFGNNTIKYFAKDPSKNVERVNTLSFEACDNCQGSVVIFSNVTPSRKIGNVFFVSTARPSITVTFDQNSEIVFASLRKGAEASPVVPTPSTTSFNYTFQPATDITAGNYTFSVNARAANGLFLSQPLVLNLSVDPSLLSIAITPADGAVINSTTTASTINLSKTALLNNITLEKITLDTFKRLITATDIKSRYQNANNPGKDFKGTLQNLQPGVNRIRVQAEDFAAATAEQTSTFFITSTTAPVEIMMEQPRFGVAPLFTFDIVVQTSAPAECRFAFNLPQPPAASAFTSLPPFQITGGVTHRINSFSQIQSPDTSSHKLHVLCRQGSQVTTKTFDISVDTTKPSITSLTANPNPVIERALPGADIFTTNIIAGLNEPGFCRLSLSSQNFATMQTSFLGSEDDPALTMTAPVNVTSQGQHTVFVACENRAGLVSDTGQVNFTVNTNATFTITSTTPAFFNTTNITLGVAANKRAFCFFGEASNAIQNCFGGCSFSQTHQQQLTLPQNATGRKTFFAQCNTGSGGETSQVLSMPVTVDITPPRMLFVNDSTTFTPNPDISTRKDRLRVAFKAEDNESGIAKYQYRIEEIGRPQNTAINFTDSLELDGDFIIATGLNLTQGETYVFRVKAFNALGMASNETLSDGVTVDTTKTPSTCSNNAKDINETDVDCGGLCDPCASNKICQKNSDCSSNLCSSAKKCIAPTCTDGIKTVGFETDIDCGGNCTAKCSNGKSCIRDIDCSSGSCQNNICQTASSGACSDGKISLDSQETDVDCGGSCPGCGVGKNCLTSTDCQSTLVCSNFKCVVESELPTPDSRKFSCNDNINDAFRKKYFESVDCSHTETEDFDDDGLTNLEEMQHNTNPTLKDTDGDGYTDGKEVDAGTDPLDPEDHPKGIAGTLLWILLSIIVLAGAGFGGYYLWKAAVKKKPGKALPPPPPLLRTPILPRAWQQRPAPIARPMPMKAEEEEFVPLAALERTLKGMQKVPEKVFSEVKALREGTLSEEERKRIVKGLKEKFPGIFSKLREMVETERRHLSIERQKKSKRKK